MLGIFFDGTGNNAVNTRNMLEALTAQHFDINSPDAVTILARNASEKMGISGIGAGSYLGYYTNIHWLNELYVITFPPESSYIQNTVYVEGIGTRAGEPDNPIGLGLGTAETGIIAKTDDAVAQLATTIDAALGLLKGKFIVDKLRFDIFGFSRGAAAARHFANRVQAEDQSIISAISAGMGKISYRGAPAGRNRFLGIMDTVAAVGTLANGLNPHSADTGNVDIRLRPGVAEKYSTSPPSTNAAITLPSTALLPPGRNSYFPALILISAAAICPSCGKTFFSPVHWWKPCLTTSQARSRTLTSKRWRSYARWSIHRPSCPSFVPVPSPRTYGKTILPRRTTTASRRNGPFPL